MVPGWAGLQSRLISFRRHADQARQTSTQANFRLPLTCLTAPGSIQQAEDCLCNVRLQLAWRDPGLQCHLDVIPQACMQTRHGRELSRLTSGPLQPASQHLAQSIWQAKDSVIRVCLQLAWVVAFSIRSAMPPESHPAGLQTRQGRQPSRLQLQAPFDLLHSSSLRVCILNPSR